jgi:hypothetical protein
MARTGNSRRALALAGVAVSLLLLIPGLFFPVLSIRGNLNPDGTADLTHQLLDRGINDSTVEAIRPLLNPGLLPAFENSPNGLRGTLVNSIESQLVEQLKSAGAIEIYSQTRSIVGSVRHLYSVGSYSAATLILLFSVIVPFAKSCLVSWAALQGNPERRRRALSLVEGIAKWSMADVFAVAIIIAFLAAQASQTVGSAAAIVSFDASFGPGFYWFAGYCLFSLAAQQATARWLYAGERESRAAAVAQRV